MSENSQLVDITRKVISIHS